MARPTRTDESVSTQGSPVRDGIRNKASISGATLIVAADMSIWDDTNSKFLSENDSDLKNV